MFKKPLFSLGVFSLAFAILIISALRSSSIFYSFAAPSPKATPSPTTPVPDIVYQLPYPGTILPGSLFWDIKALRDKIWYTLTFSPLKKASLALLFSDKRLVMSQELLNQGKADEAATTLIKGEKYLEMSSSEEESASGSGYDTSKLLTQLAEASLKHRQVIEQMTPKFPEDARPLIIKTEDYSKNVFDTTKKSLISKGLPVPNDPFSGK